MGRRQRRPVRREGDDALDAPAPLAGQPDSDRSHLSLLYAAGGLSDRRVFASAVAAWAASLREDGRRLLAILDAEGLAGARQCRQAS